MSAETLDFYNVRMSPAENWDFTCFGSLRGLGEGKIKSYTDIRHMGEYYDFHNKSKELT